MGKPEGKRLLGDIGVDERIILICIFDTLGGGKNGFHLAQDRERWRTLVNAVMNLRVS